MAQRWLGRLWCVSDEMGEADVKLESLKDLEKGLQLQVMGRNRADYEGARVDLKRKMKEIDYDVQDIRESWQIYAAARDTTLCGWFCPVYNKVGCTLQREIESIRNYRLNLICHITQTYTGLQAKQEQPTEANQVPLVQLSKEVAEFRVKESVGFEDEEDSLINCLMQETEELDVISITGMPGIGKTTLAQKIYQSETIRTQFPTRIWVDIPHEFCRKDLYLNILKEFIKQDRVDHGRLLIWLDMPKASSITESVLDNLNERGRISDIKLMEAVKVCLESRRFLLVMDAVWTADSLTSVTDLSLKMGKVLITTCNTSVCVDANVKRKPHVLRFLNEKESWDLLQLEVFGKLFECPEILKSTGESIAKNCDGLPLAIVAVGARLGFASSTVTSEYLNEQWWKKVSKNVMAYLADDDKQRAYKSIELIYNKLTQCLQDCFLYLGVFPQGQEIPVWTTTRLWIAERLVRRSLSLSMEEIADQTLSQLVDRSLVMVGKTYPNGQIKTCRLHPVMYGFCKYKAAELEFYHEIRMSERGEVDHPISLAPNHRRLCVYSHFSEFFSSASKKRQVHSILCLNKEYKDVDSSTIHKCFDSLRVLECRCVSFAKFPKKLSKMMLLRYICLSCDDLAVIPKSISSLCCLETLVVDTQSASIQLKANIWRMIQMRHLVTKAAIVLAIRGKGGAGKNLQTLTRLAPKSCTEEMLTRTPNLKTLGIRGNLASLPSAESLKKLKWLQHLKLIHEAAAEIQLNSLDCFPPTLKRLTLSGTYLKWERMSILGMIDGLEILKLKNNAFVGESWSSTDAAGFCSLRFLLIGNTDLKSWQASSDCFPNLKCLVLKNCEKLDRIPLTLAKCLDKVGVDNVSDSAVASAREIEQEIVEARTQNKVSDPSYPS